MILTNKAFRTPILTWAALMALMLATTFTAFVNLGVWTPLIALVIAACQASLIGLFLMHALRGSRLVRISIIGGLVWLSILMLLTVTDYLTRGMLTSTGK